MATIKATVQTSNKIQAKTIALGQVGRLTDLADVDPTLLDDGAMIIYDLASERFVIKNEVDNPQTKIIGGIY